MTPAVDRCTGPCQPWTGALALANHGQVENAQGMGGKEHECSGHRGHVDPHLLFQKAALAATDWEKEAPVLPNLKFQNVDF